MQKHISQLSLLTLIMLAHNATAMEQEKEKAASETKKLEFEFVPEDRGTLAKAAQHLERETSVSSPQTTRTQAVDALNSITKATDPQKMLEGVEKTLHGQLQRVFALALEEKEYENVDVTPFATCANKTKDALIEAWVFRNKTEFKDCNIALEKQSDELYAKFLSKAIPLVRKYVAHPSFLRLEEHTKRGKNFFEEERRDNTDDEVELGITVSALYESLQTAKNLANNKNNK